ncbi:MAG: glucuronate isomerase [Clostridia bacterium]|nr:glucuronate isomerase [Clostridia bacterium]
MTFINDDFMLKTPCARHLYHTYAKNCKIIDYHCHLDAALIAENHRFEDASELFLSGDHYKWRLMRAHGVEERFITGDAPGREKWRAFARTLPYAVGNPIYHWTHLELYRYFGIEEMLTEKTADEIYERVNDKLCGAREFIENSGVELVCTTNDPTEDLQCHRVLQSPKLRVLPTFRPDRAMAIEKDDFWDYMEQLNVTTFAQLEERLAERIAYFAAAGCVLSDHSFEKIPFACGNAEAVFAKRRRGEQISALEEEIFKTAVFRFCAKEYSQHAMAMQLHIGAMRNNNSRMFARLGPDSGFDSLSDGCIAASLSALLDSLEKEDSLPKTVLYCLNPKDNATLASMAGNFQNSGVRGKIQFGSAWWFCDHRDGMEEQLRCLASMGVLGDFIGMLTDSRSFVSYTRHEYFRRILCSVVGGWVDAGEYPRDEAALGTIIRGICHDNIKEYLNV